MTTTARRAKMPASYFRLVEKFPLVSIEDEESLDAAQVVLDDLLAEDADVGVQAYIDALTDLIAAYETEHYPMPDAPAKDVIRLLMESNELTAAELGRRTGIATPTVSDLLSGKRKPTTGHISKLAKLFNVSPAVFIPVD